MSAAPDPLPAPRWPTVRQVVEAVSREFGAPMEALLSDRRDRAVVRPRQAVMGLSREMTRHGLVVIGRALRRDHSTVLHGCAAHRRRIETEPQYAARVARVKADLTTSTPETPSE